MNDPIQRCIVWGKPGHKRAFLCLIFLCLPTTLSFLLPSSTSKCHLARTHASAVPLFAQEPMSMNVALAIVPPDRVWDSIQRSRHIAKDSSFTKWPPAIRLFHPFDGELALKVAEIIDRYEIEPFEIQLKRWSVIPNAEALEIDTLLQRAVPSQIQGEEETEQQSQVSKEREEVQRLIQREEEIGRLNRLRREQSMRRKRKQQGESASTTTPQTTTNATGNNSTSTKTDTSPDELLKRQKKKYEEFNGPCMICLEPDAESRQRLQELRQLLKEELFADTDVDLFSPSSSVNAELIMPHSTIQDPQDFRPLVPIAAFSTVTSAIEMAKTLRKLWKPLKFPVTDLHVLSADDELSDQFGCDALIMLYGEEEQADPELVQEMADFLVQQGERGGADPDGASPIEMIDETFEEDEDNAYDLMQWLDDQDDEFDEGTVVVIGRTHFFTGEMRNYVGMPATSMTDAKDVQVNSGVARRRGVVHRGRRLRDEGDFGHVSEDFSPWSKQERGSHDVLGRLEKMNEDDFDF